MYGGGEVRHAHLPEPLGRQSGGGHGEVKDLGNGGPYGSLVPHAVSHDYVVGHDACLAVGRTGQEVEPGLAGDRVGELDGIAHGIYVLLGGLQVFVDPYPPHLAQPESSFLCQPRFCPYAYAQQYHVCLQGDARLEMHCQHAVFPRETLHGLFQIELHALFLEVLMDECGHGVVDGPHDLVGHLHDSYVQSCMFQVLCHLQTYEAASHDDGPAHLSSIQECLYTVRVADVAEREDALAVDAGQRGNDGGGSGREQQFVVGFCIIPSVSCAYRHRLLRRVYLCHLALCPHVYVEPPAECFGGLDEEFPTFLYDAAYVVRKSAVGVGDVLSFLYQKNLCLFCQSSYACCCRSASSHAANDDDSHALVC